MRLTSATAILTALLLVALSAPQAGFADGNGYGEDDRPLLWDVPEGFVHEPGIRWVAEQGITVGFEDNSFRPSLSVTRGQMASFIARALDLEEADETFPDVPADFVHAGAISAVAAAGITVGFPDGTFRPAESIMRGQMASFIARALDLEEGEETFPDVPADFVHAGAISAVAAAGITTGFEDGTFRPGDPVTRGQMATFLFRALAEEPTQPPVDPELPETPETPVAVGVTALGEVLVDAAGMTLYIFDNDVPSSGVSACTGGCADNWPPLLVEGAPQVGDGLDADLLGLLVRDDESVQVSYAGWPLYTWINDTDPGDTTGQGVNNVWWVISPDGTPIRVD